MSNIKIHNLQSSDIKLVDLISTETAEINGGFKTLFALTALISGVKSGSVSVSATGLTSNSATLAAIIKAQELNERGLAAIVKLAEDAKLAAS